MTDTLIVYYSRTGKTRMVAEKLAAMLGADIEQILEQKPRHGFWGYLAGIKDSLLKRPAALRSDHSVAGRKAVVIGMPVWAAAPPPAVRAYIEKVDLSAAKVFAFCTQDASGGAKLLKRLAELLPAAPAATLELSKPAKDSDLDSKLRTFAEIIGTDPK